MYRKGTPPALRQRASKLHNQNRKKQRAAKPIGGVGTELKALFSSIGVAICGECDAKANQWNRSGIEWCQANQTELVKWLHGQANAKKLSLSETAVAIGKKEPLLAGRIAILTVVHPMTDVAEIAAGAIVEVAIQRATTKRDAETKVTGPIPVAVTVSPRDSNIHRRTFDSILAAGFQIVRATCEPGTVGENLGVPYFIHAERQGQWRNFANALRAGVKSQQPYFITAEDDVEFCRGTAAFLLAAGWPAKDCGCLQLYSAMPLASYPVGRRSELDDQNALDLCGACALMFRRDAATALLEWADNKGWRGDTTATVEDPVEKKAADTFVGEVLTMLGFSVWAHNPSIVNHIGDKSTLGHDNWDRPNRRTLNFPGVDADLNKIFAEELNANRRAV